MGFRGGFGAFLAIGLTFVATSGRAQDDGFEAGLRTGYGVPAGKAVDGATGDINDAVAGVLPVWLEAGYRASPRWLAGVFFQYGFGFISDKLDCDLPGADCSTNDIRAGVQVHFHVAPTHAVDPWVGYGFGYEWWTLSVADSTGSLSTTASGFELANFQFGADVYPAPNLYVGPFLSVSLDQYNSLDATCSGAAVGTCGLVNGSIDDKTLHEWLLFGIRGGFTAFARRPPTY